MRVFGVLSISCVWILASVSGESIHPVPVQRNNSDCGDNQPCPNPDANLVSPELLPDESNEPNKTSSNEQIDKDTIQCIYYQTYEAECQVQCSEDPIVWDIDPTHNMKIMKRECHSTKTWHFKWEENDGVLDSTVFPHAKFRPPHDVVAICTFSRTKAYFDCSGIAVCDPKRSGIDQCSGGLPWRGLKWSGDPLKEKSPRGNITSYAQNSPNSGSSDGDVPEPETTTHILRRSSRRASKTTTESDTNDDFQSGEPRNIFVVFLSPFQSFVSDIFRPVRTWLSGLWYR